MNFAQYLNDFDMLFALKPIRIKKSSHERYQFDFDNQDLLGKFHWSLSCGWNPQNQGENQ